MPSYYRVSPKFWTDPALRGCSDNARLLALYLLTGPHRRLEGLFRLPKPYICADLAWTPERLGEPFTELLAIGFLRYDEHSEVALVVNALKYQSPENDNQVTAALKQLDELPDTPLTSDFRRLAERFSERLAKRLPERFGQPLPKPPAPAPAPAPAPEVPPTAGRETATATLATVSPISTAQTFVAAYVDAYRGRAGHDPPSRVKGQLARELGRLFDDGIPPDTIKAGFVEWFDRDQHPSTLPSFVEAHARNGRPRATTRQERGRAQLRETHDAMTRWAASKEGGPTDGTSRLDQASRPAERELPRPGTST